MIADLDAEIAALAHWRKEGGAIVRTAVAPSFRAAVAWVNRIADAAEDAQHHPDLTLSYNRLGILLTTHDEGGITHRDLHLARVIDDIVGDV